MKKTNILIVMLIIILCAVCLYYGCNYYNTCASFENTKNELTMAQNKLKNMEELLYSTQDELFFVQNNLNKEIEKSTKTIEQFKQESESIKNDLEAATTTIEDLKSEEYEMIYVGNFTLTHYCCETYDHICGNNNGLTATGTYVTAGRTVAVDPSVIPYGTEMYIEGYGWRIAEDCGGVVDGNHIDIAVSTHADALNMGTTDGGVWVMVRKYP